MSYRRHCTRWLLPMVLILLCGIDLEALAIPRDPAPTSSLKAADGEVLLVARRRRRRPERPKARPKKVQPPKVTEPADDPDPAPTAAAAEPADASNLQRGGRVEFDGRLVQGQTAKSGAIYLFARQRTDLRSMVRERESYRREVLRTVYSEHGSSK